MGINLLWRPASIPNIAVNKRLQESVQEGGTGLHTLGSERVILCSPKLQTKNSQGKKKKKKKHPTENLCPLQESGKMFSLTTKQRIGKMSDNRPFPPSQVPLTLSVPKASAFNKTKNFS